MGQPSTTAISALEAARRIYNTPAPTPEQVGRVVERIEFGALARSPRGGATTTIEAVAEYLARHASRRSDGQQQWHPQQKSSRPSAPRESLGILYRDLLKDYFLALLLRRRATHRSAAFQRVVLASQVGLLVGILCLVGGLSSLAVRARLIPPDHRVVRAWVAEKYADATIGEIRRLETPPSSYRVRYRYGINGRVIESSVILTLDGPKVVNVNSEL